MLRIGGQSTRFILPRMLNAARSGAPPEVSNNNNNINSSQIGVSNLNPGTVELIRRASTTSKSEQANAAAQAKPNLLEVYIDDVQLMVEPGTTILEAAAMAGVEIPRFCYHERLSVAGNCRMCLVEVEKSAKPVAACAMPVMNGTRVKTNSEFTKKAREGVMEFLLMNHPLDCPICDQGGECDLQDQSMMFGSDRSRLQIGLDAKRAVEDKNIGPLVKTIMNRCIHCTRCVRFMNEIAGCPDLGTTGRGGDMQIGTYLENTLLNSELSGNIVDLCPVGALTSKPYAFTARPWELRRTDSIDVLDAVGSSISVCHRAGDLLRILPRVNDEVNEEWLGDKSRHAPVDGLKRQRLTVPYIRPSRASHLQACDWEDALLTVASAFSHVDPKRITAIVGPQVEAESMVAIKDLLNNAGSHELYVHVDSSIDSGCIPTSADLSNRSNYLFNSTIMGLESEIDFLLLVGTNPRFEAPLVNARIRKAWRNHLGCDEIALIGPPGMDLLYDYEYLGDSVDILNKIATGSHPVAARLKSASRPAIILGQQILRPASGQSVGRVYDVVRSIASQFGAEFNLLHSNASQVAAYDLGFRPSTEMATASGDESALLWLIGVDDPGLELPKNSLVIYQGSHGDICSGKADVVLPGSAFTEKDGTYCNMEGRVQQTLSAITAPGAARNDWKIIRAVSEVANLTLPYDSLNALRERMAQINPILGRHSNYSLPALPAGQATSKPSSSPSSPSSSPPQLNGNGKLTTRLVDITDYFQTDPISRASPTMAKCLQAVKAEREKNSAKAYSQA